MCAYTAKKEGYMRTDHQSIIFLPFAISTRVKNGEHHMSEQ